MTVMTVVLVVLCAGIVTAALSLGVDRALRSRRPPVVRDDEPVTVVSRPTLNPDNKPIVTVLYEVASSLEQSGDRCAGGLRDIARAVQLSSTAMDERTVRRVAGLVREHGQAVIREAEHIDGQVGVKEAT